MRNKVSLSGIFRTYVALIGWLLGSLLSTVVSVADESSLPGDQNQFTIVEGRGLPVCDAYLDVLNRMPLEASPFCDRPETGPEPEFKHLARHYLRVSEIVPLFTYVWEFMRFDDQNHVERYFHSSVDAKKSYWDTVPETADGVARLLGFGWMQVWTYDQPIDIANDGMPLRILFWKGYGATGKAALCGADEPSVWSDSYVEQRAFVLNDDGKTIDQLRTRAIFGEIGKTSARSHSPVPSELPPGARPFKPLADSIGVFGYNGKYYIQTENMPSTPASNPPPVQVFVREKDHTSKVCAFRPQAVQVPAPF